MCEFRNLLCRLAAPTACSTHACWHECVGTRHAHAGAGDEGAYVLPCACVCSSDARARAYVNAYWPHVGIHTHSILHRAASFGQNRRDSDHLRPMAYGGHSHSKSPRLPHRRTPNRAHTPANGCAPAHRPPYLELGRRRHHQPARAPPSRAPPRSLSCSVHSPSLRAVRSMLTAPPPGWRSACTRLRARVESGPCGVFSGPGQAGP